MPNRKKYDEFQKQPIGVSDIACLICIGYLDGRLNLTLLEFGEDGNYSAYIVNEDAEIGAHYHKALEFDHWLKIYDDNGVVAKFSGEKIIIYRAGDFGCIIQVVNKTPNKRQCHL